MKNCDNWLELSQEKARELGYALVEHLLDYQAKLATLPVVKVESTAALRTAIWEELPAQGSDPLAVLERIQKSVLSSTNHETHPRFFAFVPGPSNLVGVYADFLRTGYNIFAGSWLEGSGPAMVELVTLDWIRKLAGYPETAGGNFFERRVAGEFVGAGDGARSAVEAGGFFAGGGVRVRSDAFVAVAGDADSGLAEESISAAGIGLGVSREAGRGAASDTRRPRGGAGTILRDCECRDDEYGRDRSDGGAGGCLRGGKGLAARGRGVRRRGAVLCAGA
jgi:hypothetical protein